MKEHGTGPNGGPAGHLADEVARAVLDALDEAAMVFDAGRRFVAANDRLWRLFELPPTRSVATVRSHIAGCVADGERYLTAVTHPGGGEAEFDLVRPAPRRVRRRVVRLCDGDGGEAGWLVAYRDITREAQLDRLKSEFVASLSHELRTPMTAVKGFLDVLLDDDEALPAELRRQFLGLALAESERLAALIDDLLDLSRLEAGRWVPQPTLFGLAELCDEVAQALRPGAEAAGLTLAVSAPRTWRLRADRDQIHQVLSNLLANAVKFTPRGGQVTLTAEAQPPAVRLTVADTGCGIAAPELERLFERFGRLAGPGAGPRGAGLGLALVHDLVTAHGGRVEVRSTVGKGSVFSVWLPGLDRGEEA